MKPQSNSRRTFLIESVHAAAALGVGAVLLPSVGGCKKNELNPAIDADAKKSDAFTCNDNLGLTAEQKAIRDNLRYVDSTPIPTRTCDNCKLYTRPQGSSFCGGCKVMPGVVHPKGYCNSWYHLM